MFKLIKNLFRKRTAKQKVMDWMTRKSVNRQKFKKKNISVVGCEICGNIMRVPDMTKLHPVTNDEVDAPFCCGKLMEFWGFDEE